MAESLESNLKAIDLSQGLKNCSFLAYSKQEPLNSI